MSPVAGMGTEGKLSRVRRLGDRRASRAGDREELAPGAPSMADEPRPNRHTMKTPALFLAPLLLASCTKSYVDRVCDSLRENCDPKAITAVEQLGGARVCERWVDRLRKDVVSARTFLAASPEVDGDTGSLPEGSQAAAVVRVLRGIARRAGQDRVRIDDPARQPEDKMLFALFHSGLPMWSQELLAELKCKEMPPNTITCFESPEQAAKDGYDCTSKPIPPRH